MAGTDLFRNQRHVSPAPGAHQISLFRRATSSHQLLILRLRRARDLAGALGAYERGEGDAAVNAWLDRYDAVGDALVLDPLKPWLPR